jgi:predicted RNA-binding Zn ribbon-like protein
VTNEIGVGGQSGDASWRTDGLAEANDVPSEVALVYEFVNTLDLRSFTHKGQRHLPTDEIETVTGLRRWLLTRDLLRQDYEPDGSDLARAHRLRRSLRDALILNSGGRLDAHGLAELASSVVTNTLTVRPTVDGRLRLTSTAVGVNGALGVILAQAVEAGMVGTWRRLKTCPAADCSWVFYDHSKSRIGRWCETEICGNRLRTQAYRRRVGRRNTAPRSVVDRNGYLADHSKIELASPH